MWQCTKTTAAATLPNHPLYHETECTENTFTPDESLAQESSIAPHHSLQPLSHICKVLASRLCSTYSSTTACVLFDIMPVYTHSLVCYIYIYAHPVNNSM